MKKTEFFYFDSIDVEATCQYMKGELLFLKQYAKRLRLQSALYGEETSSLQVEDELVDYMHYTKSIVHTGSGHKEKQDAVLRAMEQRQRVRSQQLAQDERAYMLLQAILQLDKQKQELLLDMYVRGLPRPMILRHQGDVVESTLNRRLRRSYVQLAVLLKQEVYAKQQEVA